MVLPLSATDASLSVGFAAGSIATALVWVIVSIGRSMLKKHSQQKRANLLDEIGRLVAEAERINLSHRAGDLPGDIYKKHLFPRIDAIVHKVNASYRLLDSYQVKYFESVVRDLERAVSLAVQPSCVTAQLPKESAHDSLVSVHAPAKLTQHQPVPPREPSSSDSAVRGNVVLEELGGSLRSQPRAAPQPPAPSQRVLKAPHADFADPFIKPAKGGEMQQLQPQTGKLFLAPEELPAATIQFETAAVMKKETKPETSSVVDREPKPQDNGIAVKTAAALAESERRVEELISGEDVAEALDTIFKRTS